MGADSVYAAVRWYQITGTAPHFTRMRNRKKRETALITGASSGIGKALAQRFAQEGFDVVLVARSAGKLAALAATLQRQCAVRARVYALDLLKPGAVRSLAVALRRSRVSVDVLVNNAGVIEARRFADLSATSNQHMIALNIAAATDLLSHFLPAMIRRGHGRVLNVCSVAAFVPVPGIATYAATKAYLLSLTESVSEEVEGTGVTVTALCPGITATHMKSVLERGNPRLAKLPGILVADADSVAAEGYEACMRGEVIRVPGLANQLTTLSGRALPRWVVRRLAGFVGRRVT